MAKRTRRLRDQLPNCYYEGYLEKSSFKDETSRKLWTALCGNVLFFFNDKRECGYIEKLDLSGFISVTDDTRPDCNSEEARFNLRMKNGNIKFTAPNTEARDLWKGYIQSVAELAVPTSLNLLPGQIHMLAEAVEKEKERKQKIPPSANDDCNSYVTVQADMPACYHSVSRLESELLLDREAKRGNLLLRPGSDGNSFAVSTRQDVDSPVFKHYRVIRKHDGGFIIDVDPQVPCSTLQDVINYLVETTDGTLIPLIIEEPYEKKISYISSDNENGEKSLQQASLNAVSLVLPPKPVSRNTPSPEPEPAPVEESWYLNDKWNEEKEETKDSSPNALPPKPEKKCLKVPLMPPTPAPRKLTPSSATNQDLRQSSILDANKQSRSTFPLAALSELKLKLEQKGKYKE